MSWIRVGGIDLFYDVMGAGDPLVLVHGSWNDHHSWQAVVRDLADSYRVLVFDRRGHSQSERPPGQGYRIEDEEDLSALIEKLGPAPAHVVGTSFGASIVLGLLTRRPDLFRSVIAHEPPLTGIIADDSELKPKIRAAQDSIDSVIAVLQAGNADEGARRFVEEIALGPGRWEQLPSEARSTYVTNASTWVDEQADPNWATIDLTRLSSYAGPVLLTTGSQSPPWFSAIIDKLSKTMPQARVRTYNGAGHVPHVTHPNEYVANVTSFLGNESPTC